MSDDYETHELEMTFKAGAASRDAEVAELQKAIDENWVTHQQIVAASKERDQLRTELAAALAACKVKDEALESCGFDDDSTDSEMCGSYHDIELVQRALAIQPDDSALKAFMQSKVVSYE